MTSRRSDKVAGLLQREIGQILRAHLADPRLGGLITVARVTVSPDLAHATVAVTVMGGDDEADEAFRGIGSASGFLRREVAQRLRLRRAPELHFVRDAAIEQGNRVLDLLDALPPTPDEDAEEETA